MSEREKINKAIQIVRLLAEDPVLELTVGNDDVWEYVQLMLRHCGIPPSLLHENRKGYWNCPVCNISEVPYGKTCKSCKSDKTDSSSQGIGISEIANKD